VRLQLQEAIQLIGFKIKLSTNCQLLHNAGRQGWWRKLDLVISRLRVLCTPHSLYTLNEILHLYMYQIFTLDIYFTLLLEIERENG